MTTTIRPSIVIEGRVYPPVVKYMHSKEAEHVPS